MPVGCLCLFRELWHLDYGHARLFQQLAALATSDRVSLPSLPPGRRRRSFPWVAVIVEELGLW